MVERVFNIGDRRVGDIMMPRPDIDWIDAGDSLEEILATIRACRHEQVVAGRGGIEEPLAMALKHDLLHQVLDGQPPDPLAVIREPLVIHEGISIFRVLERFRTTPVRVAMVLNEYGGLEDIVPRPICWQPLPATPCADSPQARGCMMRNAVCPCRSLSGK